jgi:hypothetical protein
MWLHLFEMHGDWARRRFGTSHTVALDPTKPGTIWPNNFYAGPKFLSWPKSPRLVITAELRYSSAQYID